MPGGGQPAGDQFITHTVEFGTGEPDRLVSGFVTVNVRNKAAKDVNQQYFRGWSENPNDIPSNGGAPPEGGFPFYEDAALTSPPAYPTDNIFEFGVGGETKKNSSSWILEDYRNAKTERNWGYYRVIHQIGKEVKVKELVIEPGQALSNQYHDKRNELWYVMKGEVVMNGVVQKEHGPAFLIPKGYWHLAKNVSDKPCHILECQYGEECTEDDIHRDWQNDVSNENDSQHDILNENDSQQDGTYVGLTRNK